MEVATANVVQESKRHIWEWGWRGCVFWIGDPSRRDMIYALNLPEFYDLQIEFLFTGVLLLPFQHSFIIGISSFIASAPFTTNSSSPSRQYLLFTCSCSVSGSGKERGRPRISGD